MAAVTDKFYSNSWLYPDDHFAPGEHNLKFELRDQIGIPWDFSKYDWERGCSVADAVLRMILNFEIRPVYISRVWKFILTTFDRRVHDKE